MIKLISKTETFFFSYLNTKVWVKKYLKNFERRNIVSSMVRNKGFSEKWTFNSLFWAFRSYYSAVVVLDNKLFPFFSQCWTVRSWIYHSDFFNFHTHRVSSLWDALLVAMLLVFELFLQEIWINDFLSWVVRNWQTLLGCVRVYRNEAVAIAIRSLHELPVWELVCWRTTERTIHRRFCVLVVLFFRWGCLSHFVMIGSGID